MRRKIALLLCFMFFSVAAAADPRAERWKKDLQDPKATVRAAAVHAIGKLGPGGHRLGQRMLPLLKDDDKAVRLAAMKALGRTNVKSAIPPLTFIVENSPDEAERAYAAIGLGYFAKDAMSAVPAIYSLLDSKNAATVGSAAAALSNIREPKTLEEYEKNVLGMIAAFKRHAH